MELSFGMVCAFDDGVVWISQFPEFASCVVIASDSICLIGDGERFGRLSPSNAIRFGYGVVVTTRNSSENLSGIVVLSGT